MIQLLSKKPVGILHLLDDESNFPRASDASFLEKCHYNHALNELYSRPRLGANEFGVGLSILLLTKLVLFFVVVCQSDYGLPGISTAQPEIVHA